MRGSSWESTTVDGRRVRIERSEPEFGVAILAPTKIEVFVDGERLPDTEITHTYREGDPTFTLTTSIGDLEFSHG